jgi:hypothetical protein
MIQDFIVKSELEFTKKEVLVWKMFFEILKRTFDLKGSL